jgi:uncharacterized protein (TIGR02147 family)
MKQQIDEALEFRFWIQSELMQRCKRNPSYSLRSFAALLDMDPSSISQIISGKRQASVKVITKICERLGADPYYKEKFLTQEKIRKKKIPELGQGPNYNTMSEDAISVISNWYHFAILELMNTDHFQSQPSWVANRLSLSTIEVKMAFERLVRLNLIKEENGKYSRTEKFLTGYTPGQTTEAQKELQRQILRMALDAIDNVSIEERDMTNMTMAIDLDKLSEAKKMITKFRRDLCAFLEDGKRTCVYQFGLQLYPISKND